MPSQFVKPDLPATSISFVGEQVTPIRPGFGSTVMVPVVGSWGPLGADLPNLDPLVSMAQVDALYGNIDSPLRTAAAEAFMGQNTPGGRGAGGVIPYRMATNAAAKSSVTLQNTTPAAAIKIEAKYTGVFGNNISVVVEDDPIISGSDRLRVLVNGATIQSFTYVQADVADLKAQIDAAESQYVQVATSPAIVTGVALTAGTFPLTGGNDGSSVVSADWLDALDALQWADSGILAAHDLTDTGIKASILSWVREMAEEMRPVRAVFGGAPGESLSSVISEVSSLRDEHIVRFGLGTYYDRDLDKQLGSAQLTARIAGVLAARGDKAALTRALLGGLSIVGGSGPTLSELKQARDAGITVARRVSHPDSQLAISQGVTTFTSKNTAAKPYDLFSEPRLIGMFDGLIRRLAAWGDDNIVGDVPVNDDTRAAVRKEVMKELSALEADGLTKPGSSYVVCEEQSDPDLADSVPFEFGFVPARTANYMIGIGRVR